MMKVDKNSINWRHELKYICNSIDLQLIEQNIKLIMHRDPHADENGQYCIRSIYFDDYMNGCYRDNEDGNDPRSKWRVRIYNYSDKRITLEKKTKYKEMTNKQSCQISREMLTRVLEGKDVMDCLGENSLLDEFIIQRTQKLYHPVILGEYIRKPYVYELGNVRVTFDCNISASEQYNCFFSKEITKIPVMKTGYHVLEVKWDDFLPDVIYNLIDNGHLQQSTFSKFFLGRKALEGRLFDFY